VAEQLTAMNRQHTGEVATERQAAQAVQSQLRSALIAAFDTARATWHDLALVDQHMVKVRMLGGAR